MVKIIFPKKTYVEELKAVLPDSIFPNIIIPPDITPYDIAPEEHVEDAISYLSTHLGFIPLHHDNLKPKEPRPADYFLKETKIKGLSPLEEVYLKQTERLYQDKIYIFLRNEEYDEEQRVAPSENPDLSRLKLIQDALERYRASAPKYSKVFLLKKLEEYVAEVPTCKDPDPNTYSEKLKDILIQAGLESEVDSIPETITPFDISSDYINESQRTGVDPLTPEILENKKFILPTFLEETEIEGLSRFQHFYLKKTEPLYKDRMYVFLRNQEYYTKQNIKIELKKLEDIPVEISRLNNEIVKLQQIQTQVALLESKETVQTTISQYKIKIEMLEENHRILSPYRGRLKELKKIPEKISKYAKEIERLNKLKEAPEQYPEGFKPEAISGSIDKESKQLAKKIDALKKIYAASLPYQEELKKSTNIRDVISTYQNNMDPWRYEFLEENRDAYVRALMRKTESKKIRRLLASITRIKRSLDPHIPGSLATRDDCLESYGKHKTVIAEIKDNLIKEDTVTPEDLEKLTLLCNHVNDSAYIKPRLVTGREVLNVAGKILLRAVGITLMILGFVLTLPSAGLSLALIALGIGLFTSPGIVEGIGHSYSSLSNDRAPDASKLLVFVFTLLTMVAGVGAALYTTLAVMQISIGIALLAPVAVLRQINTPRQKVSEFFSKNYFDITCYGSNLISRIEKHYGIKISWKWVESLFSGAPSKPPENAAAPCTEPVAATVTIPGAPKLVVAAVAPTTPIPVTPSEITASLILPKSIPPALRASTLTVYISQAIAVIAAAVFLQYKTTHTEPSNKNCPHSSITLYLPHPITTHNGIATFMWNLLQTLSPQTRGKKSPEASDVTTQPPLAAVSVAPPLAPTAPNLNPLPPDETKITSNTAVCTSGSPLYLYKEQSSSTFERLKELYRGKKGNYAKLLFAQGNPQFCSNSNSNSNSGYYHNSNDKIAPSPSPVRHDFRF